MEKLETGKKWEQNEQEVQFKNVFSNYFKIWLLVIDWNIPANKPLRVVVLCMV